MNRQDYQEATKGSHKQLSRVEVYIDQELVEDTYYGGDFLVLDANGSSVNYQRLQETRTTARINFWERTNNSYASLDPLSNVEIHPYHGIQAEGQEFWFPLGALRLVDSDEEHHRGRIKMSTNCVDRSEVFRENKWISPFVVEEDTPYPTAALSVLQDRIQSFDLEWVFEEPSSRLSPLTHFSASDEPWTQARKMAEADECELYFSKEGIARFEKIADPLELVPVIILNGDTPHVQIGGINRKASRRELINGVICRGSAPWLLFPVSGAAWDEDPLSRINRFSGFGEKPFHIDDPLATSDEQCEGIAEAELKRRQGVCFDITFNMNKDPFLSVAQTVENISPEFCSFFAIEELTFPLGAGSQTGIVRRKK